MDYKDLAAILIKITGAALFFWFLAWLPSLIPLASDVPFSVSMLLANSFPAIAGLLFAVALFSFPATITNKLISGETLNFSSAFAGSAQIIAIRLIGLYHIMIAVTDLVHHISKAILTPRMYQEMGLPNPPSGGRLIWLVG